MKTYIATIATVSEDGPLKKVGVIRAKAPNIDQAALAISAKLPEDQTISRIREEV